MKSFPQEKLLRIYEKRLGVALACVQDKQSIVRAHQHKCESFQRRLDAARAERKRQQTRLATGQNGLAVVQFIQRELNIGLISEQAEQIDNELREAQQLLNVANDELAVARSDYHRARAKRDQTKQREQQWRRQQTYKVARNEQQAIDEFAMACITRVR